MDNLFGKTADAFDLQSKIVEEVFDYVDDDPSKSMLGIYAAVKASLDLISSSTMTDSTRVALAQTFFYDMVGDIDLQSNRSVPDPEVTN